MLLLLSCAPPGPNREPLYRSARCAVSLNNPTDSPVNTEEKLITVGVRGILDPNFGPWGRTDGERLLFHHLYESLIDVDCEGVVRPGLAAHWEREQHGRRWVFTLRKDARFWDGSPVTATHVRTSWQNLATPVVAMVDSVVVMTDSKLAVYMKRLHPNVPRAFASNAFAVAGSVGDNGFRLGSGVYQYTDPSQWEVGTVEVEPDFGVKGATVSFMDVPRENLRDGLVAQDIDFAISSDPDLISYALHSMRLAALNWSTTYVLIIPSSADESGTRLLPETTVKEFARTAVRNPIATRAWNSEAWWKTTECGRPITAQRSGTSTTLRIVYDETDRVARDIAERVAAITSLETHESTMSRVFHEVVPGMFTGGEDRFAEGLDASAFDARLLRGEDLAYVLAIPARPHDPCAGHAFMMERAPWYRSSQIVPLIDARAYVVARDGLAGLDLIENWFGDVLVANELIKAE